MPNRPPLAPISGNKIGKKELSPYLRGIIIGRSDAGQKYSQIADALNIPRSTVIDTVDKRLTRTSSESLQRSRHPRKLTIREECYILHAIRQTPKITYK